MIRREFTGMLPGAIEKFEKLLEKMAAIETAAIVKPIIPEGCEVCPLQRAHSEEMKSAASDPVPRILKGYGTSEGKNSYFSWGVACRMKHADMKALRSEAEALGITWLTDDGDMAYTGGLLISDFKTFRVGGALKLTAATETLQLEKEM